ncbi:TetR family transcriptional regulator [Conexibacter sp. W3-3-2]|uniref:TetR family transcriptional regulator n=1 Tax=Paraconexibacter algicola TaxID=2133960 RepID=A0A2T4UN14_9ACTN|nr:MULTISPECIES: TetR/AcrR family transcriptional regulator [Solirubrobacterales]MTD44042.1 TetR family transcriptional regulator [Conexibacter sp. W3-3-2]PTL60619.1 TetR family transcriptional regulator [Paraconexibacter algicola]
MSTSPTPVRKRADAVRNREAVVRAATELFTREGPDVGVDAIAARAGVGKATVYRSFPTKEHLVAAVAAERLRWMATMTDEWSADASVDGWTALREVLRAAAGSRARGLLTHGLISDCDDPELVAAKAESTAAGRRLLARAQADGSVRADVAHEEIATLFRGLTLALTERGERDVAVWLRHADLLADAVRAR